MNKKYFISIIIPIGNNINYLKTCFKSISHQSYKNFEAVLVCDDFNTPETIIFCKQYSKNDPRFKVVQKSDRGISAARNFGLENALYEYITFIDSDDAVSRDYLLTLIEGFIKYNVDMTICGHTTGLRDKTVIKKKYKSKKTAFYSNIEAIRQLFLIRNYTSTVWNKMFKKSLIADLKFDTSISYGEDLPFVYFYLKKCNQIYYSNKKLYHYYLNADSLSFNTLSPKRFSFFNSIDNVINDVNANLPKLAPYAFAFQFIICLEYLYFIRISSFKNNELISDVYSRVNISLPYYKFVKSEYKTLGRMALTGYYLVRKNKHKKAFLKHCSYNN